jgi:hypothetical protein
VKFGHKLLCRTVYFHFLTDKRLETEPIFTHYLTGRYIAPDMFMKCVKVNLGEFAEIEDSHTAADVNAHYIGNYLVTEVACETNDTTGTGVNVGHNAYLLVGKHINRKEFLDLVQGVLLDVVRKYLYVIFFYYPHILMLLIFRYKGRLSLRNHFAHCVFITTFFHERKITPRVAHFTVQHEILLPVKYS